ncbi:MAG: diacylglycerol kinase family protein [Actinomycetota bacterium]
MTSTVHLVANPAARAGRAAEEIAGVSARLGALGADVTELVGSDADETAGLVDEAVAGGAERVVVLGGDGLVHLAVQSIAQSPTVLGLIPSGTGNDFAGALGLDSEPTVAVEAALGEPSRVDLMRIGSRWGASVATAGFSVAVNERANGMRFPRGASRYTVATLLELPRMRATGYQLAIDDDEQNVVASLVTIANTSDFGGGMRISPSASPTDGMLDVTVVGEVGRVELLTWFRKVFDGSHLDHPKVSTFRGRAVTVTADVDIWADGEPAAPAPVTIEAVPGALLLAGVTLTT